ncbi:CAT1 [Symbiodinium sp. CCMP2592]|nr:CAT1 [Symbiodinium sp. CCMP2592]
MSPHVVHDRLGGALGEFSTPLSDVGRTRLQVEAISLSTFGTRHECRQVFAMIRGALQLRTNWRLLLKHASCPARSCPGLARLGGLRSWTDEQQRSSLEWFHRNVQAARALFGSASDRVCWESKDSTEIYVLEMPGLVQQPEDVPKRCYDLNLELDLQAAVMDGSLPSGFDIKHFKDQVGALSLAASHFHVQNLARRSAAPKPIVLVLEDGAALAEDFRHKVWSLIQEETPCDWNVLSLSSSCPTGRCTSPHLARIGSDLRLSSLERCREVTSRGFRGILYRTGTIADFQNRWMQVAFDFAHPDCLSLDASLGAISDEVAFYAVPAVSVDIWSMGCIFTEINGGPLPYEGINTLAELTRAMLVNRRTPVIPPTIPAVLQAVISGCYQFEGRFRPSARQVYDQLREAKKKLKADGILDKMLQLLLATKTRQELFQDDAHGAALHRSLTTWDLLAIGVGSTVGTGVFSITSQVAAQQAGPAVLLCWCAGGAGCMLSALAYMELSARLPVAGSVYAFAYHALGEVFAVVAAGCITLEYGISASAVAANWGDKFRTLVASLGAPSFASHLTTKIGPVTLSFPALVVLLLVTTLVYVGGDLGKRFARVSSALAVLLILLMVAAAMTKFQAEHFDPFVPSEFGASGVMSGCVTTFFGFLGYDEVCCMAGEALEPQKSVPRAVLGTVFIATLLPALGSVALVGFLPYSDIDANSGFEVAFRQRGWTFLSHMVSIGELIVLFVVTYMCFLAQPRVFYALSMHDLLPRRFRDLDEHGTPWFATLWTGLLLIACGALLPFSTLANAISGGVCVAFNLVNCSLIVLRRGGRAANRQLGAALVAFNLFSFLAAVLLQHGGNGLLAWSRIASLACCIATLLALVLLAWQLGASQDEGQSEEAFYRVPYVPWIPCCAMVFNNVMLSSLKAQDFLLLAVYLLLVVCPYLTATLCRFKKRRQSTVEVSLAAEGR